MPPGLKIKQLPKEIHCWLTSLLLSHTESMQLPKEPQMSNLACGIGTKNISQPSDYKMTHPWITPQLLNGTGYWDALHKLCMKGILVPNNSHHLLPKSSSPLWITYIQPFSLTTGKIPTWITVENTQAFYSLSTKDTWTKIQLHNHRKQSFALCSEH